MSRLILPSNLRSPKFRCRVPIGGADQVCNKPFFEGEERAFQAHVIRCVEEHAAEVQLATPQGAMPELYGSESGDVEFKAWVERHRDALLEDRKRI